MAKNHIITGLDIGSGDIKVLVIAKKQGQSEFDVLAHIKESSNGGIRKGVVIDPEKVSQRVRLILQKAEELSGHRINRVRVNANGSHIFATPSHGAVAVSRADGRISGEDIDRVMQAAQAFSLPPNKKILEVFPTNFVVDGAAVKDALGTQGVRLEVDTVALCAFTPYMNNLINAVASEIQIDEVVPSPLAAARAVLTSRQKELGVALVDIGAGTTGLAVFEEGDLMHSAVFPVGSANITNDIAICLRCDIDLAERIKKEFGSCIYRAKGSKKKIEIPLNNIPISQKKGISKDDSILSFSQKMLIDIVEARVSEIFDLINKELKKISRAGLLPAGIVLTGGGAKIPQIVELAKKELKLPVRLGFTQEIRGIEDNPSWTTVCGLALVGVDEEDGPPPMVREGFFSWFKKILKNFIP